MVSKTHPAYEFGYQNPLTGKIHTGDVSGWSALIRKIGQKHPSNRAKTKAQPRVTLPKALLLINAQNPVEALLSYTLAGQLSWKKSQCQKSPLTEDSFFAQNGTQEFHLTARYLSDAKMARQGLIPDRLSEWDLMVIDGGQKQFHIDGHPIRLDGATNNSTGEELLKNLFCAVYQSLGAPSQRQSTSSIPEVYLDYLQTIRNQMMAGQVHIYRTPLPGLEWGKTEQSITHISLGKDEPTLELTQSGRQQIVRLTHTPHGTVKFSQTDLKDFELSDILADVHDWLQDNPDLVEDQTVTAIQAMPEALRAVLDNDDDLLS